jgi:hypothetical protein
LTVALPLPYVFVSWTACAAGRRLERSVSFMGVGTR